MPPKSRMCHKRPNKNSKCGEAAEAKVAKINHSKIKCGEVNLCDIISRLKLKSNHNIVNNLIGMRNGNKNTHSLHKVSRDVLIRNISTFSLCKNESPFDRRITCIEWHPRQPRTLAVASKGGDILIWNCETSIDQQLVIPGKGAGGAVQCIKFHPEMQVQIYTASIDGTVASWDHCSKTCTVFLKTHYYDKWYTSLDVCPIGGHFIAGDNGGYLTMLSLDGQEICKTRLHKNKITHAEYNARQPWLVTTSSIDHTVKMWDLRNMKGYKNVLTALHRESALAVLHHDLAVNSAYFSLTDSTRLLTTDQHSQLRVYKGPLWELERIISHPHRQFQHLTPIKATWHPLEDIVVVGRYPDEKFPGHVQGELRTVDFIDAETGKYKYGLSKHGIGGIVSLNHFNILGDTLASGMGFHILIWRQDLEDERKQDIKLDVKKKQRKLRIQERKKK